MSFYNTKLSWKQPKEETDQMQRFSKGFIIFALSVTEAEAKMVEYIPSNYQDAIVEEVKKTNISDLKIEGNSEVFWTIKLITNGEFGAKPFVIVLNGNDLDEILKKLKIAYFDCEVLAVQKMAQIVDEDLISSK